MPYVLRILTNNLGTMKSFKSIICLLFCLPLFFLSCSKDNDEKQDDLPPVVHEFKFLETAFNDFYTNNLTPVSIEFKDDQFYIGNGQLGVTNFDADYTYLGELKNLHGVNIKANIVRFKRDGGYFVYNPELKYLRCYSEVGNREAEINNLPDLGDMSVNAINIDRQTRLFMIYDHRTIHRYNANLSGPVAESDNIGSLFEHGEYDFKIMSIATDQFNKVYISVDVDDTGGEGYDAVLKFDADLNFMTSVGGDWTFNGPHGIAFDEANYMYVVNQFHHVVKIFDTNLELVTMSWENLDDPGSTGGQLDQPIGIRINDDKVFVSDKNNHCVTVFTTYN